MSSAFSIHTKFKLSKQISIPATSIECIAIPEVCKEIRYRIHNKMCSNLVPGLCNIFD